MNDIDLSRPEFYLNRELSLLEFNRRVLAQARDESVPLMERLRFLCIASTNMDEFFGIRVAGLNQQVRYGAVSASVDGLFPEEALKKISSSAHDLVSEQYRVLNDVLIPALEKEDVHILRRAEWNTQERAWVKRYFHAEVLPVLSPIGLDPAHPFPRVLNKNLYFIITLKGKDAFGRNTDLAILQMPRSLPRVIPLPRSVRRLGHNFVLLSSMVHHHVGDLFPSLKVSGCYQFCVTRDSDLYVDDDAAKDLLLAVEGQLSSRRFSRAVRLEVADNCPATVSDFLLQKFDLTEEALYCVNGPVNLGRLRAIPDLVNIPKLHYVPMVPEIPDRITQHKNIFDALRQGDILLNHPYQSFLPVLELLRQAASDENVLAIKQTLYRTGDDSVVVEALKDAARAGKAVTVIIELRARFDEEANIELANELQEAGAHVVYGVVGHKTHAKMMLIVRREGKRLKRYVHLGTGNYHVHTARLYTDYGLLTSDITIGKDVNKVFHQVTGLGRAGRLQRLWQSPFTLHSQIIRMIRYEAKQAAEGHEARIIAKINSLVDAEIIRELYRASQAGVVIDLIVRGISCLRPGVKGVSENIQVRSVIGRFLEHPRVFYFHHQGEKKLYCSSADWMSRNFFQRVEVCFPILDKQVHEEILEYGLLSYLRDNTQSWILQSDGSYVPARPGRSKPHSAQSALLERHGGPSLRRRHRKAQR